MFGRNSLLNLPFQVAAKTGTTNDFRDNWTLGYTPDLVTGVWVGNADYTPMVNTTGLTGAAPIWSSFMQYAVPIVSNNAPTSFAPPPGIVQKAVCASSGAEPSQWCRGGQRNEFFASNQPPLPPGQDLLRQVNIDTWTGLVAGDACKDFVEDALVMNVTDPWARKWLKSGDGRNWLEANDMPRNPFFAPDRECSSSDPHPILEFSNLADGTIVTEKSLPVQGIINVANGSFDKWQLSMFDNMNFKMAGEFKYRVGVGGFLNSDSAGIPDLKHFNGNQTFYNIKYLNSFQLAPYYKYSNSEEFYFYGHAEHHFNGLLTNKIPLFNKLKWNLVIGANTFYVNNDNYYAELFAGIENIFKMFRVDFINAYQPDLGNKFGVRLGFGGLIGGKVQFK